MSRVGRAPIPVPNGVKIEIDKGNLVKVTGPKGSLQQQLLPDMKIAQENGEVYRGTAYGPTPTTRHSMG